METFLQNPDVQNECKRLGVFFQPAESLEKQIKRYIRQEQDVQEMLERVAKLMEKLKSIPQECFEPSIRI